jgi:hypothetical protein
MKKLTFILLGLFVLLIPLLAIGCETTPAATPTPLFVTQEAFNNAVNTLTTQITGKANQSDLAAQITRIDNLAGGGGGNSYPKDQLYTKAEVDAAIDAKIKALKDNQTWITGSSGGGGGSALGSVSFVTNPVSIPQIFTSASGTMQQMYTMSIQNGTNQWQYVKPVITFSIASGQASTTVTGITISMSSGGCNLTGTATGASPISSFGNFSISPAIGTGSAVTPSIVVMPISGCTASGEFQVGAGQKIDILIVIQNMYTTTNTLWNISHSISSRGI